MCRNCSRGVSQTPDAAAAQSLPDQCLGHDSDRIGKVDEPGAGGKLGRFAGVSREDGDGAHGQGEPAGSDRFLTGEAVLERDRFVSNTAREPAHANARNDERSPVQSRFQGRGAALTRSVPPALFAMACAMRATVAQRRGSVSNNDNSLTARVVSGRNRPLTTSGTRMPAPPITVSFIFVTTYAFDLLQRCLR